MSIRTPFHDILEGGHEFYILERRLVGEGPVDCAEEDLKKPKKTTSDGKWHYTGADNVRHIIYGCYDHEEDEMHSVWCKTGYHGWWNIACALRALVAVRKANKEGAFNPTHYSQTTATWRYEWRLTQVRLAKETQVVDLETALMEMVDPPTKKKH